MDQVPPRPFDKDGSGPNRRVRSLSVACPAYNEADGIAETLAGWLQFLRAMPQLDRFEIVVCNDGSRDETGAILDRIAAQHPEVRPVHSAANRGAGAALARAIAHTTLDWVLLLDADDQLPIDNALPLIAAVEAHDVAYASGVRVKKDTPLAVFGSWSSGVVANWLHGTHFRDFNSVCKLVDGALIRSLRLEGGGLSGSTDLTSKLAERDVAFAEVDVAHRPRTAGKSSLKLLRDGRDRLAFVVYAGVRRRLLRARILHLGGE